MSVLGSPAISTTAVALTAMVLACSNPQQVLAGAVMQRSGPGSTGHLFSSSPAHSYFALLSDQGRHHPRLLRYRCCGLFERSCHQSAHN
jgi:hypothetical protein